jgi:hypothetical protein
MIKKSIWTLLVFMVFKMYSQNEVLKIPFGYESTFYDKKESLAISNESTKDLVLFVEDYNVSKAILLDENLIIKSEIFTDNLPSAFKEFIGHQINEDGTYSIFFTNNNKKKFGELNLDFSKKDAVATVLDFKLKKEGYVESISHKGKFYLISATRNSNDVNFYCFEKDKLSKKHSLSFRFLEQNKNGFLKKAYHFLVSKGFTTGSLVKMDNKIPNAIEITSKPNKLYVIDHHFVFTFDNSQGVTKVAYVSPEDFKIDTFNIEQPVIEQKDFVNHNSYLYDD